MLHSFKKAINSNLLSRQTVQQKTAVMYLDLEAITRNHFPLSLSLLPFSVGVIFLLHFHSIFWTAVTTFIGSRDSSRDSSRDGCIKEFIKRKWSSGLFWAVGAAEKKPPNCHKYATFWVGFVMISRAKNNFNFFKNT